MNRKTVVGSILAMALLAAVPAGALAQAPGAVAPTAIDPYGKIYIVTSMDSHARSLTSLTTRLSTARDAAGTELVIAETRNIRLPAISEAIHTQEKRCGGYFAFNTRAEAEAFVRNDQLTRGLQQQFATYTIDNQQTVNPWLGQVVESNIRGTIEHLSSYRNRYYTSATGLSSAQWIRDRWQTLASGRSDITTELHTNCSNCGGQPSVILTIRGSELPNEIVVLGAHLDSINTNGGGNNMIAPGADDDASGIATLTESLRIALASGWKPKRTVQFMGYAAEEVGLRGSYAIAQQYRSQGKNVVGVLQLDMTNYRGSSSVHMRMMTDYTNATLTQFMRELFATYLQPLGLSLGSTACGYGCSDHASWSQAGFPAAMVDEATKFGYLHTTNDTLAQMGNTAASSVNIAKLALAFTGELGKTSGGNGNPAPTAAFTFEAKQLQVTFADTSTDDGKIVTRTWAFGDGATSSEINPIHEYATSGTYQARLTVTDDLGASASVTKAVTVAGDGNAVCAGTNYSGAFSGANGQTQIQPGGTWYQSAAGAHRACLRGPAGADFDLYLDRWNGSTWVAVSSSIGSTADENIAYTGTAGYYRFRIKNYRGTGSYVFGLQRP